MALEHPLQPGADDSGKTRWDILWCPKCRHMYRGLRRPHMKRGPNGTWRAWCETCTTFAFATKGKGHRDLAGQLFLPFEPQE